MYPINSTIMQELTKYLMNNKDIELFEIYKNAIYIYVWWGLCNHYTCISSICK